VLAEIADDVDERVSDFTRRAKQARVISFGPYRATPTKQAVDRFRQADRQTLHTASEARRLIRFCDQMQMILLNAESQDAEGRCIGRTEGGLEIVDRRPGLGFRPAPARRPPQVLG
jgi:hypothetical protein